MAYSGAVHQQFTRANSLIAQINQRKGLNSYRLNALDILLALDELGLSLKPGGGERQARANESVKQAIEMARELGR